MSLLFFFFSSRRRHTRWTGDWSSDVCSSDLSRTRYCDAMLLELELGEVLLDLSLDALERVVDGLYVTAEIARHLLVALALRSEERREGKSVDLGRRRSVKKKSATIHRRLSIM